MKKSQESVLYGAFIAAVCIIVIVSLVTFVNFTRSVRNLLKYLKAFDKEVVSACEKAKIKPKEDWFHLQSAEIKKRFKLAKALKTFGTIVSILIMLKYALTVYWTILDTDITNEVVMGSGIIDDILLGSIVIFFNTLLYTNLVLRAEGPIQRHVSV